MKISTISTIYYRIKTIKEFISIKKYANNNGKILSDNKILEKLYKIYKKNSIKTGMNMESFDAFHSDFRISKLRIKQLYKNDK
jgi:hypothetical protein